MSPRPSGQFQGHSMDVTASTLNRTSPLDFDFAKIQPLIKSGPFLEPLDTTAFSWNDSHEPTHSKRNNRNAMRFSSNAGIIEQYARSWNSQEAASIPRDEETEFEQLVSPTSASNTPRWPFINDDSLNTPDSADVEPLFPVTESIVSQSRPIHRIDEDLEDLAALYVAPLDAVPEAAEEVLPPPPSARLFSRWSRGKVMTSAQFEDLRKQKAREEAERRFYDGEDEEDRIEYEVVDEAELVRKQMAQRKKQQAHLDSYRQRMMKTTNGPDLPPMRSHSRISSSYSFKSFKTFRGYQDEASTQYGGDEDEDDVPLALLQIHRRSDGREPSVPPVDGRPEHAVQLQPAVDHRRQQSRSLLPAFANRLPQDPYPGPMNTPWPMNNQQLIPGGLVGVIASEERAKAMRRVAPSHGFQPLPNTNNAFNWAPSSHQPTPMPGAHGMSAMQPSISYSRPQTPVGVPQLPPVPPNYEMFNFLQAQNEFLRSMAAMNQQRGGVMNMGTPGVMPNYAPSNYAPSHYAPSNYAPSSRAPSNYAPSNYARSNYARSTYARSNYTKSVHQRDAGYAPSVAPSERNTVGMPSRYRPVSKGGQQVRSEKETQVAQRVSASSGWNHSRNMKMGREAILEPDSTDSEDDDEAFWRAKKAKRDRRRAMWIQDNDLGIKAEWIS
ncbi:hypothetical protein ACLX1H_000794 [Fusarium chlamydosporum]